MPRRKAAVVGSLIRIITIIATVMHFTFGCCTHPCHLGARDACLPHAAVPATAEACCHDHDHGQEDHAHQDSHGEQSGGRLGHAEAGLTPFSAASHGCHGCHCAAPSTLRSPTGVWSPLASGILATIATHGIDRFIVAGRSQTPPPRILPGSGRHALFERFLI